MTDKNYKEINNNYEEINNEKLIRTIIGIFN